MRRLALAAALGVLAATRLPAQVIRGTPAPRDTTRARPELRIDYLGARLHAVHVGAGVTVPAGTYARVGVVAGAGPGWGPGRGAFPSVRADVVARFLIDPYRRSRIGVSIGGGVGIRHDDGDTRGLALLVVDVEGQGTRGWIPFASGGIGGGVRVTAGLRRAASFGR